MKQGRIRDADLEEVRRRVNLVEIAGEYMQLRKSGRQFRALCPFHTEKTPSFYIDPVKNLYVCHGCGEGGDSIRLLTKLENLSFPDVIERLARRTGVELKYEQMSASDRAAFKRRARLIDAHRAAIERYHDVLLNHRDAEDARAYLKSRNFSKQTAVDFQVGFSTPGLAKHLLSRGFTEEEIVDAGLGTKGSEGLSDRFRNRLMFPIFDVTGDPVAFGGRRMREDQGPKYLNSAESPIYKKSQLLYALNWAKGAVVKGARALMVEGYTDVLALHQAGIKEAVATCGTALGLEHLRTLQRFTQQVVLALDSDEAGSAAADRTYDNLMGEAQQMGVSLKVLVMRAGEDPADAVQRLGGEGFGVLVDDAIPLLEFVLRREAQRYNVGDPEVQARALAACLRLLAKTEHPAVRSEYARRLSDWIRVDPNVIHVELNKALSSGATPKSLADSALKRSSKQVRLEREALKIAIQFPEHAKEHADTIDIECFSVPAHRALWVAVAEGTDPELLEDPDARKAYNQLALQAPMGEVTERLVAEIFGRLKEYVVSRQIDELKGQLQRLNPLEEEHTYQMLFARLIDLEKVKRALVNDDDGSEGED